MRPQTANSEDAMDFLSSLERPSQDNTHTMFNHYFKEDFIKHENQARALHPQSIKENPFYQRLSL